MQTKKRHKITSQRLGGNTGAGIARKKRFARTESANQHSIATTRLPAIAYKKVIYAANIFGINALHHSPERILEDVLPSYQNYLSLYNLTEPKSEQSKSAIHRLISIHKRLSTLAKKEYSKASVHFEFNKEEQRYFLTIAGYYANTSNVVYMLPLYFLQLLEERNSVLFEPMLDFYRFFKFKTGFSDWKNNQFMSYLDDALLNAANERADDDPETALSFIANSRQYSERSGIANVWLNRLKECSVQSLTKSFADKVAKLKVEEDEEFLREWLLCGWVALNHKDATPIATFQCDGEFEDDWREDAEPVQLEETFGFVYRDDDAFASEFIEWIQMHANEYLCYSAMSWLVLTPKTREKYQHKIWFTDFIYWLESGIVAIGRYIEKYGEKLNKEIEL